MTSPTTSRYVPQVHQCALRIPALTRVRQFGGSVAEATIDIRNQFIRKVYAILTVQLIVTGAVSALSFWSEGYKNWIQSHPGVVWISVRPSSYFSSPS
jgi:FtsH-binding integral membrane protein